jgi:hypothetical protein
MTDLEQEKQQYADKLNTENAWKEITDTSN